MRPSGLRGVAEKRMQSNDFEGEMKLQRRLSSYFLSLRTCLNCLQSLRFAVLPPRPSTQLTDMELNECEETTLHDVNLQASF
ncbi:hypothetical protein SLA2020_336330 [Shorea laevis]